MVDIEEVMFRRPWVEVVEAPATSRSTVREWLAWSGIAVIAVAALTNDLGFYVAMILACLSFGWRKFTLARWLKRTDPDRRRGKICSRFFVAWGFFRIGVGALMTAFLVGMATGIIHGRSENTSNAMPPPGFGLGLFLGFGGFFVSSGVAMLGMVSALRHKTRIWLGPEVEWAYETKLWPPYTRVNRPPTSNRTKTVMISALITVSLFLVLVVLLVGFPLSNGSNKGSVPIISLVGLLAFLVALPISILMLLEMLGKRMIAGRAEECWSTSSR